MKKHFASTAYIVAKIAGEYKVLLHKHKKLGIWLAIGGHIEDFENPIEAVHREVMEETNLQIKITNSQKLIKTKNVTEMPIPESILEQSIPAYQGEAKHFHLDFVYFGFCKNPKKIKMVEEYGWFSKKDLQDLKIGKEVLYFANKALIICNEK